MSASSRGKVRAEIGATPIEKESALKRPGKNAQPTSAQAGRSAAGPGISDPKAGKEPGRPVNPPGNAGTHPAAVAAGNTPPAHSCGPPHGVENPGPDPSASAIAVRTVGPATGHGAPGPETGEGPGKPVKLPGKFITHPAATPTSNTPPNPTCGPPHGAPCPDAASAAAVVQAGGPAIGLVTPGTKAGEGPGQPQKPPGGLDAHAGSTPEGNTPPAPGCGPPHGHPCSESS